MIWTIEMGLRDLLPLVEAAGEPNQNVIEAFLQQSRRQLPPQKHAEEKRYYYLLREDPRISFSCIGTPLDQWRGGAMVKVGTRQIIGEFTGNRHLVGQRGLRLQCEPLSWLKEPADRRYRSVKDALEAINAQILGGNRIVRGSHYARDRGPRMY